MRSRIAPVGCKRAANGLVFAEQILVVPLRIGLILNDQAGDASSQDDLVAQISRHGHSVAAVASHVDGVGALPLTGIDVVAVAGGDGTVGATLAAMPTARVPIALLPTGTANNIATSLDVPADCDDAIDLWRRSHARPFDVGIATGPWGEHRFVESVGGGLVTHGIVVMDRRNYRHPVASGQLARARAAHADLVDQLPLAEWEVVLDGTAMHEHLLFLEILNISRIGPGLAFADASPFDGTFTVVSAGAAQRAMLAEWIRQGDGSTMPSPLAVRHAREVTIERCDRLHLDDQVMEVQGSSSISLRMDAGAVSVLVA
jgi:diacylglycerol kinase family enzyme